MKYHASMLATLLAYPGSCHRAGGWIRTSDLLLMRQAKTTTPLPRQLARIISPGHAWHWAFARHPTSSCAPGQQASGNLTLWTACQYQPRAQQVMRIQEPAEGLEPPIFPIQAGGFAVKLSRLKPAPPWPCKGRRSGRTAAVLQGIFTSGGTRPQASPRSCWRWSWPRQPDQRGSGSCWQPRLRQPWLRHPVPER